MPPLITVEVKSNTVGPQIVLFGNDIATEGVRIGFTVMKFGLLSVDTIPSVTVRETFAGPGAI